ncbi:MAG: response regulator [Treponema sp.]|nr:response regulator [Treponema sp.]
MPDLPFDLQSFKYVYEKNPSAFCIVKAAVPPESTGEGDFTFVWSNEAFGLAGGKDAVVLEGNSLSQSSIPFARDLVCECRNVLRLGQSRSFLVQGKNQSIRYNGQSFLVDKGYVAIVLTALAGGNESDAGKKNALRDEILRQACLEANEFIAVIDFSTRLVTLEYGSWYGVPTPENERVATREKILGNISKMYLSDGESRKDFKNTFYNDDLEERLNREGVVYMVFDFLGDKSHPTRKQFRVTWLNREERKALLIRTDISKSYALEQKLVEDDMLLKKTALGNVDFIALLDPKTENITLKVGSWLPESEYSSDAQKIIPYSKLLDEGASLTVDEVERNKFYETFSAVTIKRQLMTENEILRFFDLYSDRDRKVLRKKQIRLIWLDEKKQKILLSLTDITKSIHEEKKRNEQLKEALEAAKQANRVKSEFFSKMSHDIRTPMNAVIGFSSLLLKNADNPDYVRDRAMKILASGNHLLDLINDVLDMSKIEAGSMILNVREFNIANTVSIIDNIMRTGMEKKSQNFNIYVSDVKHDKFVADENRLEQILINLISNAQKYTDVGGKITLRIKGIPTKSSLYENISFEVEDNGRGMSKSYMEKIFTPFSREVLSGYEDVNGTGLGLAITRNLVDLMGGTINVDSKIGKGTKFTVILPLKIVADESDAEFWGKHNFKRMLVVDDEKEVLENISEEMKDTGVFIDCVSRGEKALEKLCMANQAGFGFDIVLLDLLMPDIDGLETARRIRESLPPGILIFLFTSYDFSQVEKDAKAAGVDGFIPKPFFMTALKAAISKIEEERNAKNPSADKNVAKDEPKEESVLSGINFLAAEDNKINSELLAEILNVNGANVKIVVNGKELLEEFKSSEPGSYDMILTDIQMPVMNGYDAARAIRNLHDDVSLSAEKRKEAKSIPLVAMTANAFNEDVQNALRAGMNAHTAKPLSIENFKKVAQKLLKKH